jgi:hypothetical protein
MHELRWCTYDGNSGRNSSASSKEEQKQSMDMRGNSKFACISAFGKEKIGKEAS